MSQARTLDAVLLIGVRLLLSGLVWWSGFRAISDDDYARVVIAQQFAAAPTLDPSGTSWLPFPFWLQGGAMLLFGPQLHTAIGVACASGVASTLLVWLAARLLGLARGPAFIAATLASTTAYSVWLGVATVPELLTAGLVVVGAASLALPAQELARRGPTRLLDPAVLTARDWGAVALCCATLSRYETWPVAAVFAVCCLWDAALVRRATCRFAAARFVAAAVVASAGMLLWLLHGVVKHADATFFVTRVADYQKALGGHDFDVLAALSRHPRFIVEHAPALLGVAGIGAAVAWYGRSSPRRSLMETLRKSRWVRPLLACASLVVFLIVGDLRGAGATHHPARTLLPIWFMVCIAVGRILLRCLGQRDPQRDPQRNLQRELQRELQRNLQRELQRERKGIATAWSVRAALVVACIIVVDSLHNGVFDAARHFTDRSDELAIGELARRHLDRGGVDGSPSGRVLIAAEDYGYFAMIAALADPSRAEIFDDHDPRRAHPHRGGAPDRTEALRQRFEGEQLSALIAPKTLQLPELEPLATTSKYSLFVREHGVRGPPGSRAP